MDIRHAEFQAMADVLLGAEFNPVQLKQVEDLQVEAHRSQAALAQRRQRHELSDEEYITAANTIIADTLKKCEGILGAQAFSELFGVPPQEVNGLIDRKAFLENSTPGAAKPGRPVNQ